MTHPASAQDTLTRLDVTKYNHAYGVADDTEKLLGLLGDEGQRRAAMRYLYSAILHQGTVWLATPDITDALVQVAVQPEAANARADIIGFVADVAQAATDCQWEGMDEAVATDGGLERAVEAIAANVDELFEDEELANFTYAQALTWVGERREAWCLALVDSIDDDDLHVAIAVAQLVLSADLDPLRHPQIRDRVVRCLAGLAAPDAGPTWRPAAVDLLARFDQPTDRYLDDPDLAVRLCASYHGDLVANSAARNELIAGVMDLPAVERSFGERSLPGWDGPLAPASQLIVRLAGAGLPASCLVGAALATARFFEQAPGDWSWGHFVIPILGVGATRASVTAAQRDYLAGMLAIEGIWDPRSGNNSLVWKAAGLPYDRDALRQMLD